MNWFGWFLLVWWTFGMVAMVYKMGKPRNPIGLGQVAFGVFMFTALLFGLVLVGTGNGVR